MRQISNATIVGTRSVPINDADIVRALDWQHIAKRPLSELYDAVFQIRAILLLSIYFFLNLVYLCVVTTVIWFIVIATCL